MPPAPTAALPAKPPGRYVENLESGGVTRSYILRVPKAYDATRRLPVVVLLHGWTGTAEAAEGYTMMGDKADKEGFFLAVPEGLGEPQGWNVGFLDLSGKHADDVAFVAKVLDQVEKEVGVDPDRVYVAGHSNGAMLAHLVGAKLSNRVAAIGAVAGTIGLPSTSGPPKTIPNPGEPVSAILIHGKADAMVAYEKGASALLGGIGAPDSARWWARQDGCSMTPTRVVSPNGNVITETYSGGKRGTEVTLVSIVNGPHDWPGGYTRDGHRETLTGVGAADLLWSFFEKHPKRR
jgi:polyhydroxybutyrate depolymerase